MQSNVAWAKAADYASRADEAFDDNARHLFLTLCQSWTRWRAVGRRQNGCIDLAILIGCMRRAADRRRGDESYG